MSRSIGVECVDNFAKSRWAKHETHPGKPFSGTKIDGGAAPPGAPL